MLKDRHDPVNQTVGGSAEAGSITEQRASGEGSRPKHWALLWLGRQKQKRGQQRCPCLPWLLFKKKRECFSLLVINRKGGRKQNNLVLNSPLQQVFIVT